MDGVRWTVSGVFLICAVYLRRLHGDPTLSERDPTPKQGYLTRAKHLRDAQKAQRQLEEKRRFLIETSSFRLFDLPPGISLAILSYVAHSPPEYLSLLRVSKCCQRLTFHACLPRMPVRLISEEQVLSFDRFIRARPQLAGLMQHMWVTPLKEDLLPIAIGIVKKCTNLRTFASNAYIVQQSITFRGQQLSHVSCKELTLLTTRPNTWATLLSTPTGSAFFRQLTHLRLIGDRVPRDLPLPCITHFSYGTSGSDNSCGSVVIGLSMLDDKVAYPLLHTVVFTMTRTSAGGQRISRPVANKRMFVIEVPRRRTELEIWCDSASRMGMWELCAEP
ncbi:hypothetical protein M413DRAFT_449499 [Hebeloma cylindrosporum]|uniref:F-box domain-containing protein n=1 Tax=Hebeloma cylindrosporum TaxID=76867 RepID=A0A0C3BWV4_HEBCY|nr:hypothetical protein M413DRAFT_449499 [Hebeloma cylindrosporum h7]